MSKNEEAEKMFVAVNKRIDELIKRVIQLEKDVERVMKDNYVLEQNLRKLEGEG